MGTYLSTINDLIVNEINKIPNPIIFGENINTGSKISGLTKNIENPKNGLLINVQNSEYTHCGVGFGIMLNGGAGILFAKQLDFMLLGIDHFVSTYQYICTYSTQIKLGSFTIILVVCDQGYQGPQSSFNALGDICSMSNITSYTLTNLEESSYIIKNKINYPGFRVIALSQRLSSLEILNPKIINSSTGLDICQFSNGTDVTIVCFNFSLPVGLDIKNKLNQLNLSVGLFSINNILADDWSIIYSSLILTKKLIIFDDSKSKNIIGYKLIHGATQVVNDLNSKVFCRDNINNFQVSPDKFDVDFNLVCEFITNT